MLRQNRDWFFRRHLFGALLLAIEAEGVYIGDVDLSISPEERGASLTVFIGDRSAWGKGYGREAMQLLLLALFAPSSPVDTLTVDVAPGNERAYRFFTKLGFEEFHADEAGLRYLRLSRPDATPA